LVFLHQQLLAFQHRLQSLRELAFKNSRELFQQSFQFGQARFGLLALKIQTGR
tara:strand:- start:1544 stop:1702 length:159 start_codon:yes stop_codon:yes gene_type:complete